jgi:hypothetical protein
VSWCTSPASAHAKTKQVEKDVPAEGVLIQYAFGVAAL